MVEVSRLNIDGGSLFPWHFKFIAGALAIVAAVLFSTSWAASVFLLLLSALIFTARSGLIVDRTSSSYKEYYSFFFVKTGTWKKYASPELIFINSSKVTQKMSTYHTLHSTTDAFVEYNGYLKLVTGEKIHIDSNRNKQQLLTTLNPLADFLKTNIVDYTA